MTRRLGPLEQALLAYAQMRGRSAFRTGDLTRPLRITPKQERELFTRLSRTGLIAQVRRGLYLVPTSLPLGGKWTPDIALVLNTLMADRDGRYQICGPNAFNHHGLTDQIPTRVYVYNNRVSGHRRVGAVSLALVKVADQRLGGTEKVRTPNGPLVFASRVRTLVDAVYDWSRFDSLPRAYDWIRRDLAAERVTPAALLTATLRYGNLSTIRRVGALLEDAGISERRLRRLEQRLSPTTRAIPMDPTRPTTGPANARWGVRMNTED